MIWFRRYAVSEWNSGDGRPRHRTARWRAAIWVWVAAVAAAVAACPAVLPARFAVTPVTTQTCDHLGAAQGASAHDGFVYLYGDANPGVIRQYTVRSDDTLRYTGLEIALTLRGENLINHPTGLTWNAQFGTYLGNTITRTRKGTIYHLDWPQMLIDRNLDHAVLGEIDDDLAIQGCRPEFVRRGERWLLATADYGRIGNAVRFYDPEKLATAGKTSEPGVLVASAPCVAYVQNLLWVDERSTLIVIANQIEGRRWRLVPVDPWESTDFRTSPTYDDLPNTDELEGCCLIAPDKCLLVTSSRTGNVTIAHVDWADRSKTPRSALAR